MNADAIPDGLRDRRQWVVWKHERRGGKWTKVPYRAADGRTPASVDNPRTWGTFDEAIARAAEVQGTGFVFTADDPYAGVDFDNCIDRTTGELHPAAGEILEQLGGYQERSPSQAGMHAIVVGHLNGDRHRTGDTPWGGGLEVYDQGRFFTVTGNGSGELVDRQAQLDAMVERILGKPTSNGGGPEEAGPGRSVEELLEAFPRLGELARREGKAPKDPSPSGWDFYLACESARCGLSDAEIATLIRHARRDDSKGTRGDYVKRTIERARASVETEQADPATRLSHRYALRSDPIVSGAMLDPIVYLTLRSGRVLRLPNVDDLFEPNKHTRVVSRIAKTRFPRLSPAEAVDLAQLIIALCPSEDVDPLEEARFWVIEFIARAGAFVEAVNPDGTPKTRWEVLEALVEAERSLPRGPDVAMRSAIVRKGEELWLPAGALKDYSGSRRSWPEFTADLAEIGWRHEELDVREPTTRAGKAAARRVHRRFYVGTD